MWDPRHTLGTKKNIYVNAPDNFKSLRAEIQKHIYR